MRYLIETTDNEGIIGMQLSKWQQEGKLSIIERGDPAEIIKADLIKIQKAFEYLKRAGINEDVMVAYIRTKGVSQKTIYDVLRHQKDFLKKLGLEIKK